MNKLPAPPFYNLLSRLMDFMCWGDRRVMAAVSGIAEAEYYAARDFSAGSLHKLLVHAMGAQCVWLSRWRGSHLYRLEDVPDYPTRESLLARWPEVHDELVTFLRGQTAATLESPFRYRNSRGDWVTLPLGELILHCVDHGTYHHGQINSMIKLAGGTPVSLNYYQFSLENPVR